MRKDQELHSEVPVLITKLIFMKRLFFIYMLFGAQVCLAQVDTLKYCLTPDQIGVGGYDPVSYFDSKAPIAGNPTFVWKHDGVTYQFATKANLEKFKAKPTTYLPQFGGWCSMTLAMGRATTPKYDNYVVTKGKLFLFERTLSVNGRELWLKDTARNEKTASKNYNSYRTTGKIK
jgi:YHS domain-containing protein